MHGGISQQPACATPPDTVETSTALTRRSAFFFGEPLASTIAKELRSAAPSGAAPEPPPVRRSVMLPEGVCERLPPPACLLVVLLRRWPSDDGDRLSPAVLATILGY